MLKLRLKNTSQAFLFSTLSFGLKGKLVSVYDQYNQVNKFFIGNIFDITIEEKVEKHEVLSKKINVSVKLKDTANELAFTEVVQTDSNDQFYIVKIEKEEEIITRYFPLDDISNIKEGY